MYYMLYYTSKVFLDDVLNEDVKKFETKEGKDKINYFGLSEAELYKWQVSFEKRIDADNVYQYVEPYISDKDILKIKEVNSVYK